MISAIRVHFSSFIRSLRALRFPAFLTTVPNKRDDLSPKGIVDRIELVDGG